MAFQWDQNWNSLNNNNGATKVEITKILSTADAFGTGDVGFLNALTQASDKVTIEKGIHDPGPHIRAFYLGGTWHINLVGTAAGGRAGYRVGVVSQ